MAENGGAAVDTLPGHGRLTAKFWAPFREQVGCFLTSYVDFYVLSPSAVQTPQRKLGKALLDGVLLMVFWFVYFFSFIFNNLKLHQGMFLSNSWPNQVGFSSNSPTEPRFDSCRLPALPGGRLRPWRTRSGRPSSRASRAKAKARASFGQKGGKAQCQEKAWCVERNLYNY